MFLEYHFTIINLPKMKAIRMNVRNSKRRSKRKKKTLKKNSLKTKNLHSFTKATTSTFQFTPVSVNFIKININWPMISWYGGTT